MYFCYIDESGHCGNKFNPDQPVEVLVGVVQDASKIHKTNREHSTFLRQLLHTHGIDVAELKSAQIFRGRKEWAGVHHDVRKEVFKNLLEWVKDRSCKLIVCPIDSDKFFKLKLEGNPLCGQLQFPYEAGALNVLLALQRLKYGTAANKGKTVVIMDEEGEHDKRLIKLLSGDLKFTDAYTQVKLPKRNGTKEVERLCQIIDIPFFSKSEHSQLIQIADLVAFVTSRYIQLKSSGLSEAFPGEIQIIEEFYNGIKSACIPPVHINPSTKDDPLISLYKELRPSGWSPHKWAIV